MVMTRRWTLVLVLLALGGGGAAIAQDHVAPDRASFARVAAERIADFHAIVIGFDRDRDGFLDEAELDRVEAQVAIGALGPTPRV